MTKKRKLLFVHANNHGEEKDANWVSVHYAVLFTARSLFVFHYHLEIYTAMAVFLYRGLSGYMFILQSICCWPGKLTSRHSSSNSSSISSSNSSSISSSCSSSSSNNSSISSRGTQRQSDRLKKCALIEGIK